LSDKELKSAPKDPGARYVWGTAECLKKVAECTAEDVSDLYDSLIEQSCQSANVSASFDHIIKQATAKKTKDSCDSEITICVMNEKNCDVNFAKCATNSDVEKSFASCSIGLGCDEFAGEIKNNLLAGRANAEKNIMNVIMNLVKKYQNDRAQKKASANAACTNNAARDACVRKACAENMRGKCDGPNREVETSMASQLCAFHATACQRLK
jgi:hypothetical protein